MTNHDDPTEGGGSRYCSLPPVEERAFPAGANRARVAAIRVIADKWVNGTILHYYFFDNAETDWEYVRLADGSRERRTWLGAEEQKKVVREALARWKDLGLGLEFREVASREEAEIRIGFMRGDGSWSYLGRQILQFGPNKRTMNFGWDISRDPDTAVHEIGHSLGLPHEHQNPHAGIMWDEEAVYEELAKAPNRWNRQKTYYNIIRKIEPDTVQGSNWDPDSIMHYPFKAGLIREPEQYADGLRPRAGLSERDEIWVHSFYPAMDPEALEELKPMHSVPFAILEGEQKDFAIEPEATRVYEIRTFGASDTVMVLFEEEGGELRYRTADDDSGEDRNAHIRTKLIKGHRYVLRVRLYYSRDAGETAVMIW